MTGVREGGGRILTEPRSFDTFVRETYRRMRACALLFAWDPSEAEDACQDAYLELLRSWSRVRHYESPEAWVHKIMMQRLSKARKNWFRRRELEVEPPAAATVDEAVTALLVLDAVKTLGDRQRQVVVLHCLRGWTQQQVADELGLKRGTVGAHLHKARLKLARALGLDVIGDADGGDALLPVPAVVSLPGRMPSGTDAVSALLRTVESWLVGAVWGENLDESRVLADLRARAAEDG